MKLNNDVVAINEKLAGIHPLAVNQTVDKKDQQLRVLEQLLQTEIKMGIVAVHLARRTRSYCRREMGDQD